MANEYLKRTPTSTGNRKVLTISVWYKNNKTGGGGHTIFSSGMNPTSPDGRNQIDLVTSSNDYWQFEQYGFPTAGGSLTNYYSRDSNRRFRDFSSWSHIMVSFDSTRSVAQDRAILYFNGVRFDANATTNPFPQNFELPIGALTNGLGIEIGNGVGAMQYANTYFNGELTDYFFVDGQALTPDVFGYYKKGDGYISAGSAQATDFKRGQWVPKAPKVIKSVINARGGFGVNGFYLPMNDSTNVGADLHCAPNSIITLKGEDEPQPYYGAPTTTDAYVSQLRSDPYAANLVLAVPGISTATGANLITNGNFESDISGWTASGVQFTHTYNAVGGNTSGKLMYFATGTNTTRNIYQNITTEVGKRYTLSFDASSDTASANTVQIDTTDVVTVTDNNNSAFVHHDVSFTATSTSTQIKIVSTVSNRSYFDNFVVKQEDAPRDYSADIRGNGTNKTFTPNGQAGIAYETGGYYGSAMTFDGTGDYIRTTSNLSDFHFETGDFTIESWIWKSANGSSNYDGLITLGTNGSATDGFFFEISATRGYFFGANNNFISYNSSPNTSQWNHVVAERYNGTTTIYLNGVAVATGTNVGAIPTNATSLDIGGYGVNGTGNYWYNGYIKDLRVYKGVAKYKGGFDVPKPYTPVGISTWRAVPDCTANNFATLNPLEQTNGLTTFSFSEGNTRLVIGGSSYNTAYSTVGVTTGKYYFECRYNTEYVSPGVGANNANPTLRVDNGRIYYNGVLAETPSPLQTQAVGQIFGIALDRTNSSVQFYLNGSTYGSAQSISASNKEVFAHIMSQNATQSSDSSWNFGQNPSFGGRVTAGTFTDSNGKGLFKYEPPSGFLALCEDNLPTPAIADPGKYFKTVLWTGDSNSGRSITGLGFQPDFVWYKWRSSADSHGLFDSVRGATKRLRSNGTDVESTTSGLISFDSDGFSLGTDSSANLSGGTYVAWCWKAGGAAVANTDGSIQSVVSVNQDAGFSIVSYTGSGNVSDTVGHGLEKTPSFILLKARTQAYYWRVYHSYFGTSPTEGLYLNSTVSSAAHDVHGGIASVTPTTFGFGASGTPALTGVNKSGDTYIAYCWTEIEGFSKFGSYVGNASADGPFVYCGFKPAWIMIKRTTDADSWAIFDSSRDSTNPVENLLRAEGSNNEATMTSLVSNPFGDILSNGFKVRNTSTIDNQGTYIFAAFAESAFSYSNAK